jgi:hypothetical protein
MVPLCKALFVCASAFKLLEKLTDS